MCLERPIERCNSMRRKSVFFLIISIVFLMMSPLCIGVAASSGDYEYELINDGKEIEITGFTGTGQVAGIPSIIDSKPVTRIAGYAFYNKNLTLINIPSTVTYIGSLAFGSNALTSVTIPDSVKTIEYAAFAKNQLTSLRFGSGVESIGISAFAENQLTSVSVRNSVKTIGNWAFAKNQLTFVEIGNGVTSIGDYAFYGNAITTAFIGTNVESIGIAAFWNNELDSLILPESVKSIGVEAFRLNELTELRIPKNVTNIESGAFSDNELTSVIIRASEAVMNADIFNWNQTNSADLTIYGGEGTTAETIATDNGFMFVPIYIGNVEVVVNQAEGQADPTDQSSISFTAVFNQNISGFNSSRVVVGGTAGAKEVSITGSGTTYNIEVSGMERDGTVSVSITAGVVKDAYGNKNAASTSVDNEVTYSTVAPTFSDYMYQVIDNGTAVKIIEYIGKGGEITIPSTISGKPVTRIGEHAFSKKQVTSVMIPDSVEHIEEYAFSENIILNKVVIGNGVTTIDHHAFYYNRIVILTIGNSVNEIKDYAFYSNELPSVTIPDGVTNIGRAAFGYSPLTEVRIPGSVTSIDDDVFLNNRGAGVLKVYGETGSAAETLANAKGYQFIATKTSRFSDMETTDWYYDTVTKLVDIGAISGYPDGTFQPNAIIKKGEFITLIVAGLGYKQELTSGEHWAMVYIRKAEELNIIDENEYAEIELDEGITRNEMAKIAVRAILLEEELDQSNITQYSVKVLDFNSIPAKYQEYVLLAFANGVLSGYPDGEFKGERTLTRAEAATVALRVFSPAARN